MSWGIVAYAAVGAAIGAGVGESQNAGGWKKGAMIGGAAGATAGFGAAAMGTGGFGAGGMFAGNAAATTAAPTTGGMFSIASQQAAVGSGGIGAGTLGSSVVANTAAPMAASSVTGGSAMSGIGTAMSVAGMGMSMLGAFQSQPSGGGFLQEEIVPDAVDQKMINDSDAEAVRYRGMVGKGQDYANMATPMLRNMRRQAGNVRKVGQQAVGDIKSASNTGVMSGSSQTRAAIAGAGQQMAAEFAPYKGKANMQLENLRNMQGHAGNVVKEERQLGGLTNSVNWAKMGIDQQTSIMQGKVLGDVAQMGGNMYFMSQYNKTRT